MLAIVVRAGAALVASGMESFDVARRFGAFFLLPLAVAVPAVAGADPFQDRCLTNIFAGAPEVAPLYCACMRKSIEDAYPGAEDREAALAALEPGSLNETLAYRQSLAELPKEKQDAIAAKQQIVVDLAQTCLIAAASGKVAPDGSIMD